MLKREIKFRGKDIENEHKWRYGSLITYPNGASVIVEFDNDCNELSYDVDPNTVGQFVFMKDRNKNEIYEKDIVKQYFEVETENSNTLSGYSIGVVRLTSQGAIITPYKTYFDTGEEYRNKCTKLRFNRAEIVGNIFDNLELYKKVQ